MNAGLSFLRGMVASVNPCGFVLLPTYLVYFLGMEASIGGGGQRASVRRALYVGAAVSVGFMAVFVLVGLLTGAVHTWVVDTSLYVTLVLGIGFVALGTAILAGYRPRFAMPKVDVSVGDRSVTSMAGYGAAYATASLGCTMPIFAPIIASPRSSAAGKFTDVMSYAAGMSLVVIALTVSLALANQFLLKAMRAVMRHVDLLAAALMVLSGLYLVWYFFVADVQGESDAVTSAVRTWETRVVNQLNDHWQFVAIGLVAVVAAAIAFVVGRRPGRGGPGGGAAAHDAEAEAGATRQESLPLAAVASPGGDTPAGD